MALTAPLTTAALIASGAFRHFDPLDVGMDEFRGHAAGARLEMLRGYDRDDETFNALRGEYLQQLGETALLVCTATVPEVEDHRRGDIVPVGLACRGLTDIVRHERQVRLSIVDQWSGTKNRFMGGVRKNGVVERLSTAAGYPKSLEVAEFVEFEEADTRSQVHRAAMRAIQEVEKPDLTAVARTVFGGAVSTQVDAERAAYRAARAARRT
jgi:hypothetical protein